MGTVIIIFWLIMFCTLCFQFIMPMLSISNGDRLLVMFILLIGAPFFFIVNILNNILDCILPEGWDNDEGGFY